jgi:predicted DNA-binding transcriptional regulator AlpA
MGSHPLGDRPGALVTATVLQFPEHRIQRRRLLSKTELARELGFSRRWIQQQVNENGMPHERGTNGYLAFDLCEVRAWLDERRTA